MLNRFPVPSSLLYPSIRPRANSLPGHHLSGSRADHAGTTRATLARPQTLAARARGAVVFDSNNQRLLKLRLP